MKRFIVTIVFDMKTIKNYLVIADSDETARRLAVSKYNRLKLEDGEYMIASEQANGLDEIRQINEAYLTSPEGSE